MIKSVLASIVCLSCVSATAGGIEPMTSSSILSPFVGISYSYIDVDYGRFNDNFEYLHGGETYGFTGAGKLPTNQNGVGFEAGVNIGQFFGIAFGMTHYFKKNTTVALTAYQTALPTNTVTDTVIARTSMNNAYLEVRGYYPVSHQINIIGSVGAGWIDRSIKLSHETMPFPGALNNELPLPGTDAAHELNRLTWRVGVGANVHFNRNWGFQLMFHDMPIPEASITSNAKNLWMLDGTVFYLINVT